MDFYPCFSMKDSLIFRYAPMYLFYAVVSHTTHRKSNLNVIKHYNANFKLNDMLRLYTPSLFSGIYFASVYRIICFYFYMLSIYFQILIIVRSNKQIQLFLSAIKIPEVQCPYPGCEYKDAARARQS